MSKGATRTKIRAEIRDKLLVQVGHRCVRCLSDALEVDIHHMVPVAEGGANEEDNLVVLCPTCHRLVHRYKLSVRQLQEYKRRAIEGREKRIYFEDFDDFEERPSTYYLDSSELTSPEVLPILQAKAEGWYNQLIRAAAASLRGGDEAEFAEFEYTHSRLFLPHIIAIRNRFESQKEYSEVVADIDVLLSLLTDIEIADYGVG